MEPLLLKERIKNSIELGETHFREFKSGFEGPPGSKKKRKPKSIALDIGRTLVAFANSDGGELIVGVEDDGEVTGLDLTDESLEKLIQAPKTNINKDTPLKNYIVKHITLSKKKILFFQVEKGTEYVHQTSDGRVIARIDNKSVPVDIRKINFERQEKISREYDRQFIDGASVNDLDNDLIKYVSDSISNGITNEKCLQFLDLAEYALGGLKLRRAALLLFAKDINKWHPRCEVRIVKVVGNELKTGLDYNVKEDISIKGNILKWRCI